MAVLCFDGGMSEFTWTALTADAAKAGLNKSERDGLLRAEAAETETTDVISGMIADLTSEVRVNVSSSGRSVLSADRTLIPQCLAPAACDILRWRILSRWAVTVSEARTKSWEAANSMMQAVRRGEITIPRPDGGEEQPDKRARPYYNSGRSLKWGPRASKGIM